MALSFTAFSCKQNPKETWTKEDAAEFPGHTALNDLIAGYREPESVSLILKNNDLRDGARKVTRVDGYPDIVDSLIQTGANTYRSKKFRTVYMVNDSVVKVTFIQKIIHPSSNWQGQTPWQETIVSVYPRLDRHLGN